MRGVPVEPRRHWCVAGVFHSKTIWDEITADRTTDARFFDLHRCDLLKPLVGRLVVEWDTPQVWHRQAVSAAGMPRTGK
jgi:hypothetical protein